MRSKAPIIFVFKIFDYRSLQTRVGRVGAPLSMKKISIYVIVDGKQYFKP